MNDREIVNLYWQRSEQAMKMNPSTIKTRLKRGREKLRQYLTGLEP